MKVGEKERLHLNSWGLFTFYWLYSETNSFMSGKSYSVNFSLVLRYTWQLWSWKIKPDILFEEGDKKTEMSKRKHKKKHGVNDNVITDVNNPFSWCHERQNLWIVKTIMLWLFNDSRKEVHQDSFRKNHFTKLFQSYQLEGWLLLHLCQLENGMPTEKSMVSIFLKELNICSMKLNGN